MTEVIVFTGKSGVGKTTIAAATALRCAFREERTLIISTDPTPSLSHIFEAKLENKPTETLKNLWFNELGFEEVGKMWETKFGREVYQVFSSFVSISYEEFTDHIVTILPGLTEEFMVNYIKELSQTRQYQRIIWDTAPLGQTLGLLKVPSMFIEHLKTAPRIYSRFKIAAESKSSVLNIIEGWKKLSMEDVSFLRDSVRFTAIAIPEALSVRQLEGTFNELDKYGIKVRQLRNGDEITSPIHLKNWLYLRISFERHGLYSKFRNCFIKISKNTKNRNFEANLSCIASDRVQCLIFLESNF